MTSRIPGRLTACFLLAKPRIVLLVAVTGMVSMVVEGTLMAAPLRFVLVLIGLMLASGAANAFNQYGDRDIDMIMARTRYRPIPAGMIPARHAVYFGTVAGIAAILLLYRAGSALAALLAAGAILFYAVVYTRWLKRRTPLNIVIGGAAGAAPPIIGWAAGAGGLGLVPWLMFLVIFLWTPPHFWALALYAREEYAMAGVPMLPVVAGDETTRLYIAAYTLILLPVTIYLGIRADFGRIFFSGAVLLGMYLAGRVILLRRGGRIAARALFRASILYLAVLFALMPVPW